MEGYRHMIRKLIFANRSDSSLALFITLCANILVFALPVSASYSSALGYTSLGLLVVSIIYLGMYRHDIAISPEAKLFMAGSFVFPIAITLNLLVHQNWQWSWVDNPSRLILALPVFLLMKHIRLNIMWLYLGILISACVFGATAIYQSHFLEVGRVTGWITDLRSPITFGNAALLFSVLSLGALPLLKQQFGVIWASLLVILAAGLAGYASLLSGTRGGWISIFFLLMVLLSTGSKRPLLTNFFALIVALLLSLVAYCTVDMVAVRVDSAWSELAKMLETGIFTRGSVGLRLQMWWAATLLFVDYPVWGVGLGNYYEAKQVLIEQGLVTSAIGRFSYAHSEPFHFLAEMGLMGIVPLFGLYLSFFYLVLKRIKYNKNLAMMALLVLVLRFDISLTQVQFVYHYTTILYVMIFAVFAGLMCNPYYQRSGG